MLGQGTRYVLERVEHFVGLGHGKTRCKDLESSLIEKEHSLGYQKI